MSIITRAFLRLGVCLFFSVTGFAGEKEEHLAKEILKTAGIRGGMVVHLGCGDGQLTSALASGSSFLVHGLDSDKNAVSQARKQILSQGNYGQVSVEQFNGAILPYTDNLINMVVVEEQGNVSMDEIMRVLAPGGVVCIKREDSWETKKKPWPDDIDDWSHFLHDAGNNAVADDTRVGQPRSLQWVAPPLWLRSHETPSGIQSPVSAGGRLFYLFDRGLVGITDERLPDRWSLVCRDAFNGKLLWEKELESWGWRQWNRDRYEDQDWTKLRAARVDVPDENQRRIVATKDRIVVTLAHKAPVSILDAATGRTLATVKETADAREIFVCDGAAVVYSQAASSPRDLRRGTDATPAEPKLSAIDITDGKVLWQRPCKTIRPLDIAANNGRIFFLEARSHLVAIDLASGKELWRVTPKSIYSKTLLAIDDVVVINAGSQTTAYKATDGHVLWSNKGGPGGGMEGLDLFVIDDMVFKGMSGSASPRVVGWDLHTGEVKKDIQVENLRSPEHHHRCYRNKATSRFIISSYEGAEYLDLEEKEHGQNNWVRGACRNGMMPCNGMLYAPPDQCFCQPGAKVLGYTALKTAPEKPIIPVADLDRLEKGPAYGQAVTPLPTSDSDWPTFRHDPARSGTTTAAVKSDVKRAWTVNLGGKLTPPVAAGGKLYVAQVDAHTLYALDGTTGEILWQFTAGGRIDSPPTIHNGLALVGSKDGYVYCLRADNGQLVWRFLAGVIDRRIGHFDQIESVWPVHGSILVNDGIAYFTAGRSTYLDGGIRFYGLDPISGKILHKGLLDGPHMKTPQQRDVAFFIPGANSDVLVSQDGFIYMRQKKLTPDLKEVNPKVLSSKGEKDVGLHVFSTAGLLDDSWYNRTFWMYSKRWPGFQLANQAPKTGQLLVVDDEKTYAVRVFYHRNVHSPMFFPGKKGYLIFADDNSNEPQIVGEKGAVEPLRWLPQSDYSRARGKSIAKLESKAFGLDKMMGYTRAKPPVWTQWQPVRVRAMVKAGDNLFIAGAPDLFNAEDPFAPFEGRSGAHLVALDATDGKQLSKLPLASPPIFDGMIAADGKLYIATTDGSVICLNDDQ